MPSASCSSAIISVPPTSLGIVWWNVSDFFHFEHDRARADPPCRWPISLDAYHNKCQRVDHALGALFRTTGIPDVLTLGEITQKAANDLRNRLLPEYSVISLDTKTDDPTLQVAILHRKNIGRQLRFKEQPPIVVPATPRGTRPMAVLDIIVGKNRIRCIVCHWQARFGDTSEDARSRTSDYLSRYAYDFIRGKASEQRSIVIIGDLNEEPFELPQRALHAHRDRSRSQSRPHWADDDVKRVHLYNCSWRLLGEKTPHTVTTNSPDAIHAAGTFYWASKRSWHHLDHIIVSSGLLGTTPPYLDESHVAIGATPEFMPEGLPEKFSIKEGNARGLSDHLPIVAKIRLRD
jgi:endonuclease/exonuclease/phosphatase family metal-dependent hydrolase